MDGGVDGGVDDCSLMSFEGLFFLFFFFFLFFSFFFSFSFFRVCCHCQPADSDCPGAETNHGKTACDSVNMSVLSAHVMLVWWDKDETTRTIGIE
jgi:hypothetical protein